jgi:hypothetical protein
VKRAIVAVTAFLVLAAPAAALAQSLPHPQNTVQAATGPFACSVTAAGPQFGVAAGHTTLQFGGGTSCGGAGSYSVFKALEATSQVLVSGVWHNTGPLLFSGHFPAKPTPPATNPVRLVGSANTAVGSEYRTWAWAILMEPNGHAGCSLQGPWACYQEVQVVSTTMGAVAT